MSAENPELRQEEKTPHQILLELHQESRNRATDLQNEVAEFQEAKLGIALRTLMERSADNPELINNLRDFLNSLDHQANFGDSEQPLTKGRIDELAKFLGEVSKAMRWTVGHGNRPADLKVDLKDWETGK